MKKALLLTLSLIIPQNPVLANVEDPRFEECYIQAFKEGKSNKTIEEIKADCEKTIAEKNGGKVKELTPLEKRINEERKNVYNPNVITPHKRNYVIPFSYLDEPNQAPYENTQYAGLLDNWEAKFQLSFKAPLGHSFLKEEDVLFFGFTVQSYWQAYNNDISSPFRETNYTPEIFYGFLNDFKIGEWTNKVNIIGIEHQSNGQSQPQSRSWNRIYAHFVWENDRWLIGIKPWYRLPEDEKADPNQPDGDDNPDIDKFLGNFEFTSTYKWDDQTFGIMLRNNLRSNNRGAIQLDWTFPMGSRFKGYVQYFNGYGESLIDYNESVQRLGVGVLLSDFF